MVLLLGCAIGLPLVGQAVGPNEAPTIYQAAQAGNVRELRRLLSRGGADASASRDDYRGYTPLMLAAQRGQVDAMTVLLDAGADPNALSTSGQSALSIAAGWGHEPAVRCLLAHGANANGTRDGKIACDPPLVCAARSGMSSPQIVNLLIQSGADVNQPDSEGTTPLLAARNAGLDELVNALFRAGARTQSNDE
jgi:ankyrin repeat protein